MPHYRDGTPAKTGDLLLQTEEHDKGHELVGIVVKIFPNAESCNAQVVPLAMRQRGTLNWTPIGLGANLLHLTLNQCNKVESYALGMAETRLPPEKVAPIAAAAANTS